MKNKAFLLGIDGASWNIIKWMIDDGVLPNFKEICREGVTGTLSSTIPPMSLPAWNSIFTGTNPGKHGIPDSVARINGQNVPIINSKFRSTPTLWEYLSTNEMYCIIVNDPVSYPPLRIKGIHMTGFLTPSNSDQFIYPIELKDRIKHMKRYIPEVPENYYIMLRKNLDVALEIGLMISKTQEDIVFSLLHNFTWDIFNFTVTLTDRVLHFMWHRKKLIKKLYKHVDVFLGRVLNFCLSENADLIIVSDHGFETLKYFFYINNWLMDKGFASKELKRIIQRYRNYILKYLIQAPLFINLAKKFQIPQRLPKFSVDDIALSFGTGSIFLNNSLEEQTKKRILHRLMKELINVKHRNNSVFDGIFQREDILWGPYVNRAGDILVNFAKCYDIHTGIIGQKWFGSSKYIFEQVSRTGKHSKLGIFIGYGPNITRNRRVQYLIKTWDIAPTLLHMLGLFIPDYMDGRVLKEIFKEGSEPAIRSIKYKYRTEQERIRLRLKALSKRRII